MKNSQRALTLFVGFFLLFALFIYLMLRPSSEAQAMDELNASTSISDVKSNWDKNRFEVFKGEDETSILSSDYLQSVRAKIASLRPSQKQIEEINTWLPATKSLNLIVVPDLSARLKDEFNNPGQVQNDTALLNQVWDAFEKESYLKMNSKDRLMVDVSDRSQAKGEFRTIADQLVFDLSTHKNKSNRLYFEGKKKIFTDNITRLYSTALQKTSGADYVYYFSQVLPTRIKKNSIEDQYRNVLILFTDGYLEATDIKGNVVTYTPTPGQLQQMAQGVLLPIKLPVATLESSYPNLEVYLFEVNERKKGIGVDARGLKRWWLAWLESMKVKNADEDDVIHLRQDALNNTKQEINEVID